MAEYKVTFVEEPTVGATVKFVVNRQEHVGPIATWVQYSEVHHKYRVRVDNGDFFTGTNDPMLPQVIAENQQAGAAQAEAKRLSAVAVAEAKRQAISAVDTHMGQCPQCGSRNVQQFKVNAGGGTKGLPEAACCLGCVVAWPLMLLAPFLRSRPNIELHRRCRACGHQWRV